jgi:hypothetical protein
MTGGIEETFNTTEYNDQQKKDLWIILLEAYNKGSIIACSIDVS